MVMRNIIIYISIKWLLIESFGEFKLNLLQNIETKSLLSLVSSNGIELKLIVEYIAKREMNKT